MFVCSTNKPFACITEIFGIPPSVAIHIHLSGIIFASKNLQREFPTHTWREGNSQYLITLMQMGVDELEWNWNGILMN